MTTGSSGLKAMSLKSCNCNHLASFYSGCKTILQKPRCVLRPGQSGLTLIGLTGASPVARMGYPLRPTVHNDRESRVNPRGGGLGKGQARAPTLDLAPAR